MLSEVYLVASLTGTKRWIIALTLWPWKEGSISLKAPTSWLVRLVFDKAFFFLHSSPNSIRAAQELFKVPPLSYSWEVS